MSSEMSLTSMDISPKQQPGSGYLVLKKTKLFVLIIVALILIVLVGILSGTLAAKREREKGEDALRAERARSTADQATTKSPVIVTTKGTTAKKPEPTTREPKVWHTVRLPENVVPYHYDLTIQPFMNNLTFHGIQQAHFTVTSVTKYILIHIKEMTISKQTLKMHMKGGTLKDIEIKQAFEYKENEYFVVESKENMSPGRYMLELQFNASVSIKLTGFYKSTYKNSKGETRVLLTTKFQPTDARKAFPCFDEPAMKATFSITVKHERDYQALSNMPGTTVSDGAGWLKTTFGRTVRMSAYLVCYIVCDFKQINVTTGMYNNITLRVWSSPPSIGSGQYGLKLGNNMTTFFEKFFKVLYVMPKLDMVAIPDYGSGATEHWGIVTYRQARLLVTDGVSSESNRQSAATIIGHEIAHLWFGNLVTCKWWNDLWVQEGMASYTEYYGVEHAHPDWEIMDQFVGLDWKTGMDLDALASSHPISVEVAHPKQIKEIFDSITYSKGSSIIRMLDDYLGVDGFRNGLYQYLTKHRFDAATSEDFWKAFSVATGKDILGLMNTWTLQMGYPVVTIKRISNTEATLTQKHFLLDPKATVTQKSPFNYKWAVPFSYIVGDQPNVKQKLLFNKTSETIRVSWPGDKWLKGNVMTKGFYRVTYEDDNWRKLIQQLDSAHTVFSASDRAGLIDDAFSFARASLLDYKIALSTTKYLGLETSYVVWKLALRNLGYLDKVLKARQSYGKFRQYMLSKLKPMVTKLGWNMTGSHIDKFKRVMFLRAACSYGDEDAINEASRLFKEWMKNNITINSELRTLVYYYGVANGGAKEWEFVFDQYMKETNPTTKSKLQYALSGTKQSWILNKWLSYTLKSSIVRSQDTVYVISDVAANSVGKYVAWDFSRANWEQLMTIASANNFHVTKLTLGITHQFSTKFELDQMNEFWKKYPNAGAGARARIQAAERIQASIDWVSQYAETVEDWLNSKVKGA